MTAAVRGRWRLVMEPKDSKKVSNEYGSKMTDTQRQRYMELKEETKLKNTKPIEPGKKPEPNTTYRDENKNTYRTDGQGRTIKVEGWAKIGNPSERSEKAQLEAGKGSGRQEGDEGGHIAAREFGFSGELVNLTAQDSELNHYAEGTKNAQFGFLSDNEKSRINEGASTRNHNFNNQRDMERFIGTELKKGKEVYYQADVHYGKDDRPISYDYNIIVKDANGSTQNHLFTFYNLNNEQREKKNAEARKNNANEIKKQERGANHRTENMIRAIEKRSPGNQEHSEGPENTNEKKGPELGPKGTEHSKAQGQSEGSENKSNTGNGQTSSNASSHNTGPTSSAPSSSNSSPSQNHGV